MSKNMANKPDGFLGFCVCIAIVIGIHYLYNWASAAIHTPKFLVGECISNIDEFGDLGMFTQKILKVGKEHYKVKTAYSNGWGAGKVNMISIEDADRYYTKVECKGVLK